MNTLTLTALDGIPMVRQGDDLAALLGAALRRSGLGLKRGDILVVCQKVVSKAEGRAVALEAIEPSKLAQSLAGRWGKDPRALELVLRESKRVVRMDRGVLITETGPGWVCANAGVDESNSPADGYAVLLPEDADASAAKIRSGLRNLFGVEVAVIVSDTFGRPWRQGLTEVCLGISGMNPMLDLRGSADLNGRELRHTVVAVADELAAAAGLLTTKAGATPAVLVRGLSYEPVEGSARSLIRPPEDDLFR